MPVKTDLPYPKDDYVSMLKDFYSAINGPESFQPIAAWASDNWSAKVYCSRGRVLEKAGFSRLHIFGGTIEGSPASISLLETIAYPANPAVPGFIIMTNMNVKASEGETLVFYTDLINQGGRPLEPESGIFAGALKNVCDKHGQSFEEFNAFSTGQGLLGGAAAECGMLYFFKEKDIPFLEEIIREAIHAYGLILEQDKDIQPREKDYHKRNLSRARLIEWIISEDYGIKIARENGVRMEVIEAYGFPPLITY